MDAMPLDTHCNQLGSALHRHYKRKTLLPLIASCGEAGDVLGTELRPGAQVTDCEAFILRVAKTAREHAADRVIVRLNAGFAGGTLCEALESVRTHFVLRQRRNNVLEARNV